MRGGPIDGINRDRRSLRGQCPSGLFTDDDGARIEQWNPLPQPGFDPPLDLGHRTAVFLDRHPWVIGARPTLTNELPGLEPSWKTER